MKLIRSTVLSSVLALAMGAFSSCGVNTESGLQGTGGGGYGPGYGGGSYAPTCNTAASKKTQFRLAFNSRATDSNRARCLASSVRGIGESTAMDLVQSGELRYAPSSWDQFKSFMKSLDSKGYSDLYDNTVQRYGSDNSKLFKSDYSYSQPSTRPNYTPNRPSRPSYGGSSYRCDTSRSKKSQFNFAFNSRASDSERAKCLASSVRGIGESTARDLARAGELRHAPSSWSQFKSYMKSLENKGYGQIHQNTVQRYGSDNSKLFK